MKYHISNKKLQKLAHQVFEMVLGDLVVVFNAKSGEYLVTTSEQYEISLQNLGKYWWADLSFNPKT